MIHTDFNSENWFYADNKVVVFGGTGALGSRLVRYLSKDYDVGKLGSKDIDLCDAPKVQSFLKSCDPDVIINMAGYNYNSFLHKYNDFSEIDHLINVNIWGNS